MNFNDVDEGYILTPADPGWQDFISWLWKYINDHGCRNDHRLAERIMAVMFGSGLDVARSIAFFREHGGYCDCEVVFNVGERRAAITEH